MLHEHEAIVAKLRAGWPSLELNEREDWDDLCDRGVIECITLQAEDWDEETPFDSPATYTRWLTA